MDSPPFPILPAAPLPEAQVASEKEARALLLRAAAQNSRQASVRQVRPPPARTSEVLLFLVPGADPRQVARDYGLQPRCALAETAHVWVFSAATPEAAEQARAAAAHDARVSGSFLNRRVLRSKLTLPPDPYQPNNSPPGFPGQWHLGNGASSTHANLAGAWARNLTGSGVLLSIVDDGLETTHEDLAANYVSADSLNHGPGAPTMIDFNPAYDGTVDEDRHGTCVGGVAAAVGGNGVGGSGAAPLAGLACQRIDFPTLTDAQLVSATLYHSNAANNNIKIKNHSYGATDTYVDNQPESNAVTQSAFVGTIHAYAAGNERGFWQEDSNKGQPQNNPDVITVAAIGSNGIFSDYSSFGSNVFVTAPSSSAGLLEIITTDRSGPRGYCPNITLPIPPSPGPSDLDPFPNDKYTSTFGGTSSATPLVAGILALAKEANPALTVRMAQHAIARSSVQVHPTDGSVAGGGNGSSGSAWITNNAGFAFNQNYGFGMIDADKLTQQVLLYNGVSTLQTESTGTIAVNTLVPDNTPAGITKTFTLTSTLPLEGVLVTINFGGGAQAHTFRGDLEAYLSSPKGTTCRLIRRTPSDNGVYPDPGWVNISGWTFLSNAFWGENPSGLWSLQVADVQPADTGTWTSFSVTVRMGHPTLAGTVLDGPTGPDISTQTSTTSMSAHWTGFNDPTIPIASYAYAIGTLPGFSNILPFTDVGLLTSASTSTDNITLALNPGTTYYVTVRATDTAGIESLASSDGVQVTGVAGTPEAPLLVALAQPVSVLCEWEPSPSPSAAFYRLWWKPSTAPWGSATLIDNIAGLTTTVSGLTNGTAYDFLLRAVTATGNESPGSISSATPGNLITMNGAGNYGTIQAAITAAAAVGGTVNVLAGSYVENLTLPGGVTLVGASPRNTLVSSPSAGTDVVTATGTYLTNPIAIVSNLGLSGGSVGIAAGSADLLVRNVVVHHAGSHGISAGLAARLQAINCTLAHNGGDGLRSLGATLIRNCIAAANGLFGFNAPPGSPVSYSDSYGNPSGNVTAGLGDATDFTAAVAFINEAANDYREAPGSVSIDTGDPGDAFAIEPSYNGGRINQGAFGNTAWAGRSALPVGGGGGGGGGGCGLLGLEGLLLLGWLRRRRKA